MASNGNFTQQDQYKEPADQQQTAPTTSAADGSATAAASATNNPSKDEVGWYFVEQFYTTLSKSPEKLHVCYLRCQCAFFVLTTLIAFLWQALAIRLWSRS